MNTEFNNNSSISEMTEFVNARWVEFNDRVIVVEENEKGVKLRAIGRGFKADWDSVKNKWICYTPIPNGFRSAYKEKFSETFDSEYRVYIDELIPDATIFTFAFKDGYIKDGQVHWECPWNRNAPTFPKEFIEAIKNSFDLDISELPITKVKRRVSSESLDT